MSPWYHHYVSLSGEAGSILVSCHPGIIIMQVSVEKREHSGIMSPWYHHYVSLSGEAGSILVSCHPGTIIMQVSMGSEVTFWYL